jgi:hypothetical protein
MGLSFAFAFSSSFAAFCASFAFAFPSSFAAFCASFAFAVSSSFAALLGNKKMADTSNAYIRYFLQQLPLKDSNTVGIIASTGNRVLGADVFLSPSLFYQTITQVLEKYTAEALLQGSTPAAQHERESKYANELFTPSTQQEVIRKRGKNIFYKGVLIQITAH